ncbi:6-phospho-beta-glucosidase [Microlunatus speluncae]|uniref:family 4 glycosyl hydrolase n=1 Tax=Microlunatus speluncae TaxID=2594267 RepID=UPI0012660C25|nr:6-phospho-beta-glucosidase [Microlunatus speluncae]
MRLTIIGGGGFRVPLIFRALAADPERVIDELVLYDTGADRLRRIGAVIAAMAGAGGGPAVRLETDLEAALRGADFVFQAIRVGGTAGRVCDERSALELGLLGQETTGAGGLCYGLRTVPVVLRIAETVRRVAPEAWLINFTNPAGMVTEAAATVLGSRVIGICDSPVGLFRRAGRALGLRLEDAEFDYAGLNHLGWLRRIMVGDHDRLPELLAADDLLGRVEEGRLFGGDWLRSLGAIPNEYLWYWYATADAVDAITAAGETRGEYLARQQDHYFAAGERDPLDRWETTRQAREETYLAEERSATGAGARDDDDLAGGGYEGVALELIKAIGRDRPARLVLNVANRGTLTGLDDDAVVEVPCVVDGTGPRPLPAAPLEPYQQGVVITMKDVERTVITAARTGSRSLAVRALALHPLVDSVRHAQLIIDRQLAELPQLREVLGRR